MQGILDVCNTWNQILQVLPWKISNLKYENHLGIIRASQFIHLSLRKDVGKKAGKKLKGSSKQADRI